MRSIRQRIQSGEVMAGTWLVLGSSLSAEIAGKAGFDWVLIDMEHGMGDLENLLFQLQAIDATPAQAIVRVAWNEPRLVKRVLDWGSSGIMIPYVSTAAEAQQAARSLRYPPQGVRGLTPLSRPADFGVGLGEYYQEANDQLLTVVQIETPNGVKNADEIAAVDGTEKDRFGAQ